MNEKEALARQVEIERYRKPRHKDLLNLREWLISGQHGRSFLAGKDEDVWDEEKRYSDYIAVADTGDVLLNRLAQMFLRLKRVVVEDVEAAKDVQSLGDHGYQRVVNGALTVIASMLPVLPVVILFLVKNLAIRLGLVFMFAVLFAAILTFGLQVEAEKVIATTTA